MAVEHKTMRVDQLQVGMYVSRLDRPWIETPFPLQGFYIRDLSEIDQLRHYSREVTIDLQRSRVEIEPVTHAVGGLGKKPAPVAKAGSASLVPGQQQTVARRPVRVPVYKTVVSMPQEVASSKLLHGQFSLAVMDIYRKSAEGHRIDGAATREITSQVVQSVIRNPDAMVWLSRMRDKDSYSYHHAFRCAIWGAVLGRHLGISQQTLENLALGLTLMDIGKARMPAGLLDKRGFLTAEERVELRRHVDYGLEMLAGIPGIPAQVVQIVAEHHERYDGSGYPNRLMGKSISPLGKIAGLVDTYDAMTSDRPYARALSSVEAVSKLYELRNREFQSQLVEEFIQAIGVYPTGTLVQLSNHEVGVVIAQNPDRRLRPKLLVLLDAEKKPVLRPHYMDLLAVTHDSAGEPLSIVTSLSPGSFGIDPARVRLAS